MYNLTASEMSAAPSSTPEFRELSAAETEHVSGGIVPAIIAAAVIAIAIIENTGDDSADAGASDED